MSYRSGQYSEYSEYPQHHAHDHGRTSPARRQPARPVPVAIALPDPQEGYTLVHAGRQVRFGPVAFWIVVGTVTLLGIWSAATATYFAFRSSLSLVWGARLPLAQNAIPEAIEIDRFCYSRSNNTSNLRLPVVKRAEL